MQVRIMDASALRIGDVLIVKGNRVQITKLVWGHGTIEVNNSYKFDPKDTVSVSK